MVRSQYSFSLEEENLLRKYQKTLLLFSQESISEH